MTQNNNPIKTQILGKWENFNQRCTYYWVQKMLFNAVLVCAYGINNKSLDLPESAGLNWLEPRQSYIGLGDIDKILSKKTLFRLILRVQTSDVG